MSRKYDYTSSTPRITVGTRVHHHEWGPGVAIPPTGHTHPAYTVVQYDSGRKWRTRTDCLTLEEGGGMRGDQTRVTDKEMYDYLIGLASQASLNHKDDRRDDLIAVAIRFAELAKLAE